MAGDWWTGLETALQALDPAALHAATFGLLFVEGMGVPGVPGVIPMMAQAGLIEVGQTTLLAAIFWGSLGNWLGSLAGYAIGRWGRHYLPAKWQKQIDSPQVGEWLERYGPALVVISRVVGALRTPVTFGAGAIRFPFTSYVIFSLLGAVLHIGLWQWLLWAFGREILDELRQQGGGALWVLGAAALAYGGWLWYKKGRNKPAHG